MSSIGKQRSAEKTYSPRIELKKPRKRPNRPPSDTNNPVFDIFKHSFLLLNILFMVTIFQLGVISSLLCTFYYLRKVDVDRDFFPFILCEFQSPDIYQFREILD